MNFLYSLLIILGYSYLPAHAVDTQYEEHTEIIQKAKNQLLSSSKKLGDEVSVSINPIDRRLKLKKCASAIQISTKNSLKAGRNTLQLSCSAPAPWRIFITASIDVMKNILVTKQFLSKGHIITQQDVMLKKVNLTKLHKQYFESSRLVLNMQLTRSLQKGSILSANNLTAPLLIKRGDKIDIIAQRQGFKITMKGVAMENGSQNASIKVKNLRTKKIIRAQVTNKHAVRVVF